MKGHNLLYIKKRTFTQWLTMFVAVMPLLMQALLQFFGLPSATKYLVDAALAVVVLFFFFTRLRYVSLERKALPFVVFLIALMSLCLVVYIFNYQSAFYFLWGMRNNFRFYFAFLAFIILLETDDVDRIFQLIDILFVINIFVSIYQIAVLGFVGDFCGGIFGVKAGSNGSTLLFFSIVTARSLLKYMNGDENTLICGAKCATALILSAFAELKFFFIVFVVILILASLLTRFSIKKFVIALAAVFVINFSTTILSDLFGSEISINKILGNLTYENYATADDVGRFTAIPRIAQTIHKTWLSKLFGMGLGNCDTAAFAICNTPFFRTHKSLNYIWFSSACWFLETGFVGLGMYLSFFAICFFKGVKRIRRKIGNLLYAQLSVIMAFMCLLLTFYNSSLRTDIAFLAYFILALPYIGDSEYMHTIGGDI